MNTLKSGGWTYPQMAKSRYRLAAYSLAVLFLTVGCASTPAGPRGPYQHPYQRDFRPVVAHERPASPTPSRAAEIAQQMIGTPYRYGGESPREGFDCSGLVQYSFSRAGLNVPRNTSELTQMTVPVEAGDIRQGDLLFFRQSARGGSHVAIALGGTSFVHAPSSGKSVRTDRLSDPYWQRSFSGARRFPFVIFEMN